MEVFDTRAGFAAALDAVRTAGRTVGLVPTMGYLHEGHRSLVARSVAERDVTAVTIFVNPLQFGEGEDLAAYPRDLERDLRICAETGADVVLAPSVEEMYPEPMLTTITVDELSGSMEGASRPTHFAGVATVVGKLFNLAGWCHAYFGEKDYQQLAIIRRMARDLSFPVEVVGCPIVRDADGLALSSRNVYLTPEERVAAPVLHRSLQAGAAAVLAGESDAGAVRRLMAEVITAEPLAELDYAEVVEADSLRRVDRPRGELRLLVAARFGRPRLLDNVGVVAPHRSP